MTLKFIQSIAFSLNNYELGQGTNNILAELLEAQEEAYDVFAEYFIPIEECPEIANSSFKFNFSAHCVSKNFKTIKDCCEDIKKPPPPTCEGYEHKTLGCIATSLEEDKCYVIGSVAHPEATLSAGIFKNRYVPKFIEDKSP